MRPANDSLTARAKHWLISTGWLPAWLHLRWQQEATDALLSDVFGYDASVHLSFGERGRDV